MIKYFLGVIFSFFFVCANAQINLNLQLGRSSAFNQVVEKNNTKGILKTLPYNDITLGIGAGYTINPKLTLLLSLNFNSYGWRVRMNEEGKSNFKNKQQIYNLDNDYNSAHRVYKASAVYNIYNNNKIGINFSGGLGIYHTRCTLYGWSGFAGTLTSQNSNTSTTFIKTTRKTSNIYTFYNTLIHVGAEFFYTRNKQQIGLFSDLEQSFGKNYDNTITYQRGAETGSFKIINRGLLFRIGVYYRPYLSLKKTEKKSSTTSPLP